MPETIEQTVVYRLRQEAIRARIEMLERSLANMTAQEQTANPYGHLAGYFKGAKLYAECEASFLRTLLD